MTIWYNLQKEHGFSYTQDESNNVIIRKAASAGYEDAAGIILQGHCDMVCEKRQVPPIILKKTR